MHFTYFPHCGTKLTKKEIGDEGLIPYCPRCQVPLWDMFTTSVIAAVVNGDNEVALLRQGYVSETNHVCVAGIMKLGESAEEAVTREVEEEIGQSVKSLTFIKSYPFEEQEMLMLGYKAVVDKSDFVLSQEVDSAEWIKFDRALELLRKGSISWNLVKTAIESSG